MQKLFIEDLKVTGKKVLMRVDFNVPLDGDCNVEDATRIQAALPSIQYLLDQGSSLILMSHLGRPDHDVEPEASLAPVAKVLSGLINRPVKMAPDCVGQEVRSLVSKLGSGEILLLENLRFHRAEEYPAEAPEFARELASYGDYYVNDAFGVSHRKHSSIYTITEYFPRRAAAGYLLQKEMQILKEMLAAPKRPFCALIGGAKVSSKVGVIKSLLAKVDTLLIGGAMSFTFLKAKGMDIGNSPFEESYLKEASELLKDKKLILPVDFVIANAISEGATSEIVSEQVGITKGFQGLDIGPKSIELFSSHLQKAATILWNGPVGVFELQNFARGTEKLAQVIAQNKGIKIAGGGDTLSAIAAYELKEKFTHLSTGGGATLEFIEKGTLPGIEALSDCGQEESNFHRVAPTRT